MQLKSNTYRNDNRTVFSLVIASVFMIAATFVGCSKDETQTPDYRTDIFCAVTGDDTLVHYILLDDGSKLSISSQAIKATDANATIRCISTFSINPDGKSATIYNIQRITCFAPVSSDSVKSRPRNPVNVRSVWKSGDYINLCLEPLINKEGKHRYDFCVDTLVSRTLHVGFIFERDSASLEAYTARLYHSIPLHDDSYKQDFDSITIHINTYGGVRTYSFKR